MSYINLSLASTREMGERGEGGDARPGEKEMGRAVR